MKIKVGMKVEYLGHICTVVGILGNWLELVSEKNNAEFFISKDYVKIIKEK